MPTRSSPRLTMSSSVEPPESALAGSRPLEGLADALADVAPAQPATAKVAASAIPTIVRRLVVVLTVSPSCCCWVCRDRCGERRLASDASDEVGDRGVAPPGEQAARPRPRTQPSFDQPDEAVDQEDDDDVHRRDAGPHL